MKLSLTRRYRFMAAHCLASEALSPEENAALYGKCNHAAGHGHNYQLQVTLAGEPDAVTGELAGARGLDRLVAEHVLGPFAGTRLDREVADFRAQPATAENIARACWRRLAPHFPAGVLDDVALWETRKNLFGYREVPGRSESSDDRKS